MVGRVHPAAAAGLFLPLFPIHLLSSDRQTEGEGEGQTEKQTTSEAITLPAEKEEEEMGEQGARRGWRTSGVYHVTYFRFPIQTELIGELQLHKELSAWKLTLKPISKLE